MPFDRLVKALDKWAAANPDVTVVAQTGETQFVPEALECHAFLAPEKFAACQMNAEVIVSHAGMGAILSAGMLGKPLIMMPRRHALGEHRNDHQMATARRFEGRPGIHVAWDEGALAALLDRRRDLAAAPELSHHASPELLSAIDDFIAGRGSA
jgi:UDP-N-acetylglucosamine transferase subunit ALG13